MRARLLIALLSVTPLTCANTWLPAPVVPSDNPMTPEKIALGKALFSDTRLSLTGQYSCASCHNPSNHFTDGLTVAIGVNGDMHSRHTPTLYNAAYHSSFGWDDASLTTLEAQHIVPLTNDQPVEMGFTEQLLPDIQSAYQTELEAVFPKEPLSLALIVKAIATYVRTLRPPESAWDRYVYFDKQDALSPQAKTGMALFFSDRLGCAHCHSSFNFSGPLTFANTHAEPVFHHTGVAGVDDTFRAPTLRAINYTAPYMHAGQLKSLDDVIQHYETTEAERIPDFRLNAQERAALISFLKTL